MENESIIEDISPDKVSAVDPSSRISNKHLLDLNRDCLLAIFQYLNLAEKYALIKTSTYFYNLFLYDIWQPYFNTTFDISTDPTMDSQDKDIQTDFLEFILENFPKIKGISLEIFQRCMKKTTIKKFTQVVLLSAMNRTRDYDTNCILHVQDFNRFPALRDLHLEVVIIYYSELDVSVPFHCLHIRRCPVKFFNAPKFYTRFMDDRVLRPLSTNQVSLKRSLLRWVKHFATNVFSFERLSETSTKHLHDLHPDCLREIFQHLDLAAQFSLIKSSKYFFNIILYDIWYPYYKSTFDISKDQSMEMQTKDFQIEFLDLILQNFCSVKGISLDIFERCVKKSAVKDFPQIVSLNIYNNDKTYNEYNTLEMKKFHKFPFLQNLQLENMAIDCKNKNHFATLKSIHLKMIVVRNDLEEKEFLKSVLSSNLEKFTLLSLAPAHNCIKNLAEIHKCIKLKELTLSFSYLYDPAILDCILQLPSLQILTLEANDKFDITCIDHNICYAILKKISQNPYKTIRGLHLHGMPEKIFHLSHYLQDVTILNWTVMKFFHRKSDGSVEWETDTSNIIKSFYDFVVNNKNLDHVFVRDNIFHNKHTIYHKDFEEKIHELRKFKGFKRLNIIHDYQQTNGGSLCDIAENSVRFFIENIMFNFKF